jgi:hypothetical protein
MLTNFTDHPWRLVFTPVAMFARLPGPGAYPVASSPQAWAAASLPSMPIAGLGLGPNASSPAVHRAALAPPPGLADQESTEIDVDGDIDVVFRLASARAAY